MNITTSIAAGPGSTQRGAILVTSLLLLLVLTVLGVTMMRMTNMQERMSGNTRDLNLALQGAEAGLRDGETKLAVGVLIERPVATMAAGCVYCQRGALPIAIGDPAQFNWLANAQEYGVAGVREFTGPNPGDRLAEDPRYTIEELAFVRDNFVLGQEVPEGRDFYQVSGHSTGASGQTNTVLQSTYARRF